MSQNPGPPTVTITKSTRELSTCDPHSRRKAIWKFCSRTDWKGPLDVSGPTSWLSEHQTQDHTRSLKALDSQVLKTSRVKTPHPLWAPVPVLSHPPGAVIPPCTLSKVPLLQHVSRLLPCDCAIQRRIWLHLAYKCSGSQWLFWTPFLQGTAPPSLPPQLGGKGSTEHCLREAFGKELSEPLPSKPCCF